MRKIQHASVLGVVLAMLLSCMARAQVIQFVPSDALVVIKVNNLKSTSDKLAKLAQDLGLAQIAPPAADPLGFLQSQAKIQQGLNSAGEMAFVYLDPASAAGDSGKSILLLIPVTDYKAFLSNWPDAKTDGDISEITFANDNHPSYITSWGTFAAVSPSKDIVSKKPTGGLNIPAMAAKEMSSKDAILYANFDALRAKLLPELQKNRDTVLDQVDTALKNNPQAARYVSVAKAAVNQAWNVAEGFLTNTQAATFGIAIAPEGINTTTLVEFAPGTYPANIVGSVKNSDASFLAGLPSAQYLFYGGGGGNAKTVLQLFTDFTDPILKEVIALGPDMQPIQDYITAFKANMGALNGSAFGMIAPTGAIGTDPLLQFVAAQSGDAKTLQSTYTQMMQAQPAIMKAFNAPGADFIKPAYTPNAKTIDGVSFDQIITKVDMNAQNPVAMQQAQMMSILYGPQGAVINYGAVDDNHQLIYSGLKDETVSAAIKAIKDNAAPLADNANVKAVNLQLPKQRSMAFYIAIGDIASTGLNYARQFGFAMPLQIPPDLPPIGVTASTDGTAVRFDSHIPETLVQSLVAAGLQMKMQQQQGQGAGGGI